MTSPIVKMVMTNSKNGISILPSAQKSFRFFAGAFLRCTAAVVKALSSFQEKFKNSKVLVIGLPNYAVIKQREADGAAQKIDKRKYDHDFLFFPAAHFKMMMNRRHFENAFAVGCLEITNL